jgi:2-dehydro-3-deoxygluconokinase
MSATVACFGEPLLRLSPPDHERVPGTQRFDAHYGGAEANVAVGLARFGLNAHYVSKVPDDALGTGVLRFLRGQGVDTSRVMRGGNRLGLYFLEAGAPPRPSTVTYDRTNTAIRSLHPDHVDWTDVLEESDWFHWTGITPALGDAPRDCVAAASRRAQDAGVTVSCDLNYRSKLWAPEEARAVMIPLMENVDICVAGLGAADACLDVQVDDQSGMSDADRATRLLRHLQDTFAFKTVATTLRGAPTAAPRTYAGLLCAANGTVYGPERHALTVVDRVGAGDAFAAGLIAGLLRYDDAATALAFATASGTLAHTLPGDAALLDPDEVTALAAGRDRAGGVDR